MSSAAVLDASATVSTAEDDFGSRIAPIAALGVCGVVFAIVNLLLTEHANQRAMQLRRLRGSGVSAGLQLWQPVAAETMAWVALAVASLVLVRRAPRWWWTPVAVYTIVPVLFPRPDGLGPSPGVVGAWHLPPYLHLMVWLGGLVDPLLTLAPAAVSRQATRPRTVGRTLDVESQIAMVSAAGLVLLVLYERDLVVGLGTSRTDLPYCSALFAFAALGRIRRSRQIVGYSLLIVLFATSIPYEVVQGGSPSWTYDLVPALPEAVAVVAGLSWPLVAGALRRLRCASGPAVAILVNVLNVVDAVLTRYEIRHLGAVESNDVIRLIGLPAKIVGVAVATALLYRYRKTVLAWLVLVLFAILAWHIGGILVGRR